SALFSSDSDPADGGANFVSYASPVADAALAAVEAAVDREAMSEPLFAVQRAVHEDQPYTFLYERAGVAAHGARLKGVEIRSAADPLGELDRFWIAAR
ncbi:MAG: hypothetical protein OER88_08525, partial [Planctomycetota bacterium]|nr:hypothetical protein [Planctomycetota bacterium]